MNTQDLIAKAKQYPIASVALGLSLLLAAFFYIRGMSHSEDLARRDKANAEWQTIEENVLKNSVNLETHLEMAQRLSQDVKGRLIQPTELAQNYQYFYRLEATTGVKINSLQQQPPPPPAPAAAAPAGGERKSPAPPPLFSKVGYTLSVSGQFHQVLHFLHALENGEHFYHLNTFSIQRAAQADNRLLTATMSFHLLGTP